MSDLVSFRGVEVLPDWPERVRQAQLMTTVIRNGREIQRVRFGDETEDWGANARPCHDCVAIKGEYHVFGCDVERCPTCGNQLTGGCECVT